MARRKTIDELKANSIKYEQKAKAAKEALEKEVRLEEERMDKRLRESRALAGQATPGRKKAKSKGISIG